MKGGFIHPTPAQTTELLRDLLVAANAFNATVVLGAVLCKDFLTLTRLHTEWRPVPLGCRLDLQ